MADLYTRTASSRAPRPQLWLKVALARRSLAAVSPTVAALVIWWMGALLTLSGDPVDDDDGGHDDPAVSDGEASVEFATAVNQMDGAYSAARAAKKALAHEHHGESS